MADELHTWSFTSAPVNLTTSKSPFSIIPSQEFALAIGQLLIHWSSYDAAMIRIWVQLLRYTADPVKNPDRMPYHLRDIGMRRLLTRLSSSNPSLYAKFMYMLDIAIDIQIRRNVIAHGDLSWGGKMVDGTMQPSMKAKNVLRDSPIEHEYTFDELNSLQSDCAHISAIGDVLTKAAGNQWLAGELTPPDHALIVAINAA